MEILGLLFLMLLIVFFPRTIAMIFVKIFLAVKFGLVIQVIVIAAIVIGFLLDIISMTIT